MKCRICGTDFDDASEVCPYCGTKQNEKKETREEQIPDKKDAAAVRTKKKDEVKIPNSGLIAAVIIAVVVIGIIIAVKFMLFNNAPTEFQTSEELTEQVVKCIEENDVKGLVSMSSDLTGYGLEGLKDMGYADDVEGFYREQLEGLNETFEASLSSGYTLSYEITDESTISGDEFSDNEEIKAMYPDYAWDNLSEITTVTAALTAEKDGEQESADLIVMGLKEGDFWKLFIFMYY